ncbi:MAG: hypothetical protein AMXMBFR53_35320 [Gemmatimonadota bacterium]
MVDFLRIGGGVLAGLVVLSGLTEALELGLVSLLNRGMTRDPETYFAIRNQPLFLAGKAVYNILFALAAGYLAARLAPAGRPMTPVWILAVVQTVALAWGASGTEYSRYTPGWMWVFLIAATGPAILLGGALRGR